MHEKHEICNLSSALAFGPTCGKLPVPVSAKIDLEKHSALLKDHGADSKPHSGRMLLDHLVGTCKLLQQWGCRSALCLAGLYHSVYGTEEFDRPTVNLEDRQKVREQIGQEAEELAWIFCVLDRTTFLPFDPSTLGYAVRNRHNRQLIPVSPEQWQDLVDLTFANTLENMPRLGWLQRRRCKKYLRPFHPFSSHHVQRAVANLL